MANGSERVGVVLTNLGGPGTLAEVEPFLVNLFSDRDIISLPLGAMFQPLLARAIAKVRAPMVRKRYASMGGGSPQLKLTASQAQALEVRLNRTQPRFRALVAMRYWQPQIEEVLEELELEGIGRLVVLTLYPQYSTATTGSMDREIERVLEQPRWRGRFRLTSIRSYAEEPSYLDALADSVRRALDLFPPERRDRLVLLFSAHSLPLDIVNRGDPYVSEIEATRKGVVARLGLPNRHLLSYQSRTAFIKWLGPSTDAVLEQLSREGVTDVLAIPISFVSDHIETLYDLDQLYPRQALELGISFRRAEALNANPLFIEALATVVERHLAEPSQ